MLIADRKDRKRDEDSRAGVILTSRPEVWETQQVNGEVDHTVGSGQAGREPSEDQLILQMKPYLHCQ